MRGFISFLAVAALAAVSLADGWLIKAPYAPKTKLTWNVVINANVAGQEHEAKMKQTLTVSSKDEKEIKAEGTWTDLVLDGGEQPATDDKWNIVFKPNGSLISVGESGDFARMTAPAAFVYPEKEIKAGDKWTAKFTPKDTKEITVDYEVVEQAKIGETEVLKIKAKLSEKDGDLKSDGTYWVAKDGTVVKYELDVKGWVVPIAGGLPPFDAKIKGELAKS